MDEASAARNELRIYRDELGMKNPDLAAELTRRLGKKVTARQVGNYMGARPAPKAWYRALGLPAPTAGTPEEPLAPAGDPPSFSDDSTPGAAGEGGGRRAEVPPKPLEDSKFAPTPAALQTVAKDRIAGLHQTLGAALAMGKDLDGFEHDRGVGGGIAAIWKDKSEPIADAWIAWANEGNRFAQAVVRTLSLGGAGGELALGYATLALGTAYIIGAAPENELTRGVYGRYARYRIVPSEPAAGERAEPFAGSGGPRPVRSVAADQGAARA